jgi:hypothetical protein
LTKVISITKEYSIIHINLLIKQPAKFKCRHTEKTTRKIEKEATVSISSIYWWFIKFHKPEREILAPFCYKHLKDMS